MAYSLDTQSLGIIEREFIRKTIKFNNATSIDEDSDTNAVVQMEAPLQTVEIAGVFTGSVAQLQAFIALIRGWIDGQQTDKLVYVSDLNGTINVFVSGGDWEWIGGEPTLLHYNITLIEVAATDGVS